MNTDELETQCIPFIIEENKLQILTFTNENELKKENIELTEKENQKFINKEKYLSEKYLNEYNELSLSENELKDYIENSIFCNDKLNKADIIETNMKIKRSNTDAKNPTPFTKYNATQYYYNHLGYRYVIRETSLYYNNIIKIIVENVGYAPAYKLFEINLILKSLSSNQSIEIKINTDNRKWYLKSQTENLLENYYPKLRDINYDVYFNMYDPNTSLYIKFANSNKYYKNLGYKTGSFTIEN